MEEITIDNTLEALPSVISPINTSQLFRLTIIKRRNLYDVFYYDIEEDSYLYTSTSNLLLPALLEVEVIVNEELFTKKIKVIE